eukprot:g7054.t1
MIFSKIIAPIILAASTMTPAFAAWGSTPAVIKHPRRFATSAPITTAVSELFRSRYPTSSPSDNDVDRMAAHVGAHTLRSALSASSDGALPSYEAAVLLSVLEATESACPVKDMDRNKSKMKTQKTADAADTKNNNTGGRADCDTEHEQCFASSG